MDDEKGGDERKREPEQRRDADCGSGWNHFVVCGCYAAAAYGPSDTSGRRLQMKIPSEQLWNLQNHIRKMRRDEVE